jgi:hypothetical protein
MFARMHGHVRADVSVLFPGNFITDATVCPSHGQSNGHRPSVRPSIYLFVRHRLRDNPGWRTEGLFTFKRKKTCSVYVSYKSSLASDVSNARWM